MTTSLSNRLIYFLKDFSIYLILIFLSFFLLTITVYKIYKKSALPTGMQNPKKFHKILMATTFVLFTIILVFSIFEAYFRYVYDESDALGFLKTNKKWQDRHIKYSLFREYFLRTDPFDFDKKEDTVRIGIMGDSIAFGAGIKNPKDRFSDLLEKKLKDSGYKVEVINFSIPGYDTSGEIEAYRHIEDLKFDILIWQYFLNDIQNQFDNPGNTILMENSRKTKLLETISSNSFFADYIYWRISSKHERTIQELRNSDIAQYRDQAKLAKHQKDIATFAEKLKYQKVKAISIIFPYLSSIGPNYPAKDIHETMVNTFKQNGIITIDLLEDLKDKKAKSLWASSFDPHPNESVHKLAADKLYEKIIPLLSQ